ncbi:MAG: phasin family protein [Pseudomonadota bacterium]
MVSSMPMSVPVAAKTQAASQLELWTALNRKALDAIARLADLNMYEVQQTLQGISAMTKKLVSHDGELPNYPVGSDEFQSDLERSLAYGRQVLEIAWSVQADMVKLSQQHFAGTAWH